MLGFVTGGLLATACCWLPLSLALLGMTSAGVATWLEAGRPFFLVLTAAFLAYSFHVAFLRKEPAAVCGTSSCATPSCRRGGSRMTRGMFFAHVVLVAALFALPSVRGVVASDVALPVPTAATDQTIYLEVSGMTCEGCARGIRAALSDVPGVQVAHVTVNPPLATVIAGPEVDPATLVAAIEDEGYGVTLGDPPTARVP
jgi:mercuric ion transport protein